MMVHLSKAISTSSSVMRVSSDQSFARFLLSRNTKSSIRLMSTYEEQFWSSIENEEKKRRNQKQIQTILKSQEQQRQLKESLSVAIRNKLAEQHHQAFSLQSCREFWNKQSLPSARNSNKSTAAKSGDEKAQVKTTVQITDALKTLAQLNGFDVVSLPNEPVPLAEGIMVRPNFSSFQTQYRRKKKLPVLFAQEHLSSCSLSNKNLPELVQEDVKLYRIIENQVEEYLKAKKKRITELFSFGRNRKREQNQENPSMSLSGVDNEFEESGTAENLLVIDENEILWIKHMDDPSLRLLALTNHHSYVHKAASTAISASFVVFGAVPLAYRSLHFALSYPGLSQMIAASVLGTVFYGIWSTRSIAVTRQSHVVSNGIYARIYARNDAVLWALQEGAVQRITDGVSTIYFDHLQQNKSLRRSRLPRTSADLLSLAQEVGLVGQESIGDGDELVSIPLDDAVSLFEQTVNMSR